MIGKLVRDGKADAHRFTLVRDHVDAGHFRLFAAIERKGRRGESRAGRRRHMAVALVEPFGLNALFAGLGLAVFETHAEHLHGIRQAFLGGFRGLLVHAVTGRSRTEMGKASTGQMQVRRIGMGDRRQEATFGIGLFKIDSIAQTMGGNDIGKALAAIGGFHGERINRLRTFDGLRLPALFANRYGDFATGIFDL
ncbi:hypothetical protein D3C78_1143600 [compost metagenome]